MRISDGSSAVCSSDLGATATKLLFPCHILWTHQAIEAGRVHKAKLQRGLFQCLSGLMCMLGDLRGLVIADFGRERSHEHERAVDQFGDTGAIGLQSCAQARLETRYARRYNGR